MNAERRGDWAVHVMDGSGTSWFVNTNENHEWLVQTSCLGESMKLSAKLRGRSQDIDSLSAVSVEKAIYLQSFWPI